MTEATATAAPKATRVPTPTVTVAMDDGRSVDFAGKRKMIKSTTITETADGKTEVVVRLDFVNGETRTYNIVDSLMARFAGHGAEQKLGDEIAGVEDVEDCVAAIDQLLIRLEKGEWSVSREGNGGGMGGVSILAKALIELTGKSRPDIMTFLSGKSHAEKIALRANGKLKAIVDRLEAEKNSRSKKDTIDSDALLAGLEVAAPAADAAA